MTNINFLPPELESVIGSERRDFVLESGRAKPISKALPLIFVGTFWILIIGLSSFNTIIDLFSSSSISKENLIPLIFPALGLFLLGLGISILLKKGGIFVATPSRLINYRNGIIISKDWEQFSGNIEISGKNITLEMRTGQIQNSKHSSYFVPDTVYLSDLDNVMEIEKICRQRIKENDPTPPGTTRTPEQGTDIPNFSLGSLFDFFRR